MTRVALAFAPALALALAGCASPFAAEVGLDSLTFALSPERGDASTLFEVDASAAADAGLATTIHWGDGAIAPGPKASHRYGFTNGVVVVALVAQDPATGEEAVATREVTLGTGLNAPPVAKLALSSTWVEVGEAVGFEASASSDPDADPLAFFWSYVGAASGDGHGHAHAGGTPAASAGETALPSAGETITHAFDAPGEYEVRVRALDPKGGESVASARVLVTAVIPSSSFAQDFEGTIALGTAGASASRSIAEASGEDAPAADSASFAFRLPLPGNATISLAWAEPSGQADLDLLLTDFATGEVIARAETRGPGGETLAASLPPASYGLVVVGFAGASVPFTLAVRADLVVTPETVAAAAGGG